MKFGQQLLDNIAPEYGPEPYLDYAKLKDIIHQLCGDVPTRSVDKESRNVSLAANVYGVHQGGITEEAFFSAMDEQISKVEKFTLTKVTELRESIEIVEEEVKSVDFNNEKEVVKVQEQADVVAEGFIRLEKYVNLNFMGFHKILKKHDKHRPDNACKAFYVARMRSQAWVRGDYSDVIVRLAAIYTTLRNDPVIDPNQGDAQSFLRSTTKYWIKTEDVSAVKYAILKHLPVFLQKTMGGESDSQFCNSVYLDNYELELYHGRLRKSPGAIAIRLRWYGTVEPKLVFVERKTHRDKWTGEVSAKERFIVKPEEVPSVLNNTYPIEQKKAEMLERGASQEEADNWEQLVLEITQAIASKQLVPTMRTQCMRTAFQIPFDATVRVSLDTNLCMISERGYNTQNNTVWYRDPYKTLNHTEITRFPHNILEVKLELKGGNMTPPKWVTDLQNSGMLYEVHKYSKFIHGCAVLLPEDVGQVPYWIDDVSIRDSILDSGAGRILVRTDLTEEEKKKLRNAGVGPGANQVYDHLLPFGDVEHDKSKTAVGRSNVSAAAARGMIQTPDGKRLPPASNYGAMFYSGDDDDADEEAFIAQDSTCVGWLFPFCSKTSAYDAFVIAPTSVQKIEPKIFFANERVFLHWLHNGVMLYTIASGILAFAASNTEASWARWYAMALLPVSLGFCIYALHIFLWRADRIKTRIPGRWDDPYGPIILGTALVVILTINFVAKLYAIANFDSMKSEL